MGKFRVAAAVLGVVAMGLVLVAGPAGADPQKGDNLTLECDVLGSVDIVVFSNGSSPGLEIGSSRVLVPYELHLEGTFTPSDGSDPETFEEHLVKPGPHHDRVDHCTFEESFTDEFGSAELTGEVWLSYTPTR